MKSEKSKYGQFFTSKAICDWVLEKIELIKPIEGYCLEPSFGGGVFLDVLEKKEQIKRIVGIEIDHTFFNSYTKKNENKTLLINDDFLKINFNEKFDFIIGNPPYIELSYSFYTNEEKKNLKNQNKDVSNGRLNLVHLFLKKSFSLIKEDGIIAFLLPSSILSSPVYKKIRKIIYDEYTVEYIKENVPFKGVSIFVSLLILSKGKKNSNYFIDNKENFFLSENYQSFSGRTKTLKDMGFNVSVGNIIWNKNKHRLVDTYTQDSKILLYSNNIKRDKIILTNDEKRKQYILNEPIKWKNGIVMPRTIKKNNINFFYIKNNEKYVLENHVLLITNNDINLLDDFYKKLCNGSYDNFLFNFFNSSNLTKNEILSIPF